MRPAGVGGEGERQRLGGRLVIGGRLGRPDPASGPAMAPMLGQPYAPGGGLGRVSSSGWGSETTDDDDPRHATRREGSQRQVLPAPLAQRVLDEVVEAVAVHALVTRVTQICCGDRGLLEAKAGQVLAEDRADDDLIEVDRAGDEGRGREVAERRPGCLRHHFAIEL